MSGLFGRQKMPENEKPAPLPDDKQIQRIKRRKMANEQQVSGYQSTLLSSGGRERLGPN